MRVLIADDDPVSRRLLEGTLGRLGHEVTAVADGAAALRCLLAPSAPELAILDWMMPELDGLAVCRDIRQRPEPYVYVILLTARDRREDMMAAFDAQADDFLTKPFDLVELRARLRSGERVLDVQRRLLETQAALRHLATHDHLTGLWNRRVILEELDRALARAAAEGRPIAVAIGDLDHFKDVNDRYGHPAGDSVIQAAAERIRGVLRSYDAIGRYGGEEFLMLLSGCDEMAARVIAERARAAIAAAPVDCAGIPVAVTVSLGIAAADAAATSTGALIEAADAALYRAKAAGRNRVEG